MDDLLWTIAAARLTEIAAELEQLEAVRRAARLGTLEDVLRDEYRVSCASLRSHDFVEGIRAQLVDKDRNPKWSHQSVSEVTAADVDAYFAPADPELTFP